jgi:hypothetical protein
MVDCFPTSFSISSSAPQICNIPGSVKVIMIPTVVTALTTATATTSSSSFQLETAQNNPEDPLDLSCKSSGKFYSSANLFLHHWMSLFWRSNSHGMKIHGTRSMMFFPQNDVIIKSYPHVLCTHVFLNLQTIEVYIPTISTLSICFF